MAHGLLLQPLMKVWAGIAAAGLLGFATQSVVSKATASDNGEPSSSIDSAAASKTQLAAPEAPVPSAPREWIRDGSPIRLVLVPSDVCETGAPYDVLVHFHGVPVSTEPSIQRAGLHSVVVIVNWGIGSGAYEDRFQQEGSLCGFLDGVEKSVDHACKKQSGGIRRVALSAWSAGYGAIYRVLFHPKDSARVDSILLADGLHTGYLGYHRVNPLQMEGFAKFADLAVQGQKLFAISHSEVKPYKYASTEETADFLLAREGMTRTQTDEPGPWHKQHLISRADKQGMHVRGFSGGAIGDHAQHLHGIGDNLWTLLRDRWAKP